MHADPIQEIPLLACSESEWGSQSGQHRSRPKDSIYLEGRHVLLKKGGDEKKYDSDPPTH